MPLVFAAAMGGNLSLIGAPGNLIAQSVMEEMDMGFGFFEYAKVGLPILVCGIITLHFSDINYCRTKQAEQTAAMMNRKIFPMFQSGNRHCHSSF